MTVLNFKFFIYSKNWRFLGLSETSVCIHRHRCHFTLVSFLVLLDLGRYGRGCRYVRIVQHRNTSGLCFIVHETVLHRVLELKCPNLDSHRTTCHRNCQWGERQHQTSKLLYTTYSGCATGYTATLKHLLTLTGTLIVGDVNGHSQLWHSNLDEERRGQLLSSEVEESNFLVLNEKKPRVWLKPHKFQQTFH